MSDKNKTYQQRLDEMGERVGSVVRENIAHIIFGAVVFLMFVISYTQIRGGGKPDWFNLFVNVVIQLTVFIPYRWRQKRISGQREPFKSNKDILADKVEALRANNELTLFADFCKRYAEDERRERQLAIVHNACIDTERFDKSDLTGLTKEQLKAVRRARNVRLKPINPACVTTNNTKAKGYNLNFNDSTADAAGVASKVITMVIWSVILATIVISSGGYSGVTVVVMIILRIVMCFTAMMSGIMSGEGFAVRKDRAILGRIDFINLFHEWKARRAPEAKPSANLPAVIEE